MCITFNGEYGEYEKWLFTHYKQVYGVEVEQKCKSYFSDNQNCVMYEIMTWSLTLFMLKITMASV